MGRSLNEGKEGHCGWSRGCGDETSLEGIKNLGF